jgi:hypothetical protein
VSSRVQADGLVVRGERERDRKIKDKKMEKK